MSAYKILYVNQEITPYVDDTYISTIGRFLPQSVQESGIDIRTFMTRYGLVSERRNQLHEVIRLSGQNIIIKDNDHPLIIKVASIPSVRMQTYFIDNENYFHRKSILCDPKTGKYHPDNDERAIFFAKGVLETVKNLGWSPDIIHCNGWISCLIPLYVKKVYMDNPLFALSKVVYSIYNDNFPKELNRSFTAKLKSTNVPAKDAALYKSASFESTTKLAVDFSDAVVIGHDEVLPELKDYVFDSGKLHMVHPQEDFISDYVALYEKVLED